MARAKTNTVEYFPHDVNQDKFRYMLKRKYPRDGYCVYYALLELLGGSENHFYDMSDDYGRDYFIEYTDVESDLVDKILFDLAEWGVIDKEMFSKGLLWNQQFVDNIADVYRKRKRETPNKYAICESLGIKIAIPSQPDTETLQSKVKERKANEKKGEDSIEDAHPLQLFIFKNFPLVTKIHTQLTFEDCEDLTERFPKDLIVKKLKGIENRKDQYKQYSSVYITLEGWCDEDLKDYLQKHKKPPKYAPLPDLDAEKEYDIFFDLAEKRGMKLPFTKPKS